MRIETATIKSNILLTAIFIHSMIVLFAPATIIVCTIFMQGSRRHRHRNPEAEAFASPHELTVRIIILSIAVILAVSLFLYYKNAKRKFIVAIEFNDLSQMLTLFYKTYYNNRVRSITVTYLNVDCSALINQRTTSIPAIHPVLDPNELIVDNKISFFDQKKYLGEISMGGTFWNKEGGKIKMIIHEIQMRKNQVSL